MEEVLPVRASADPLRSLVDDAEALEADEGRIARRREEERDERERERRALLDRLAEGDS